MKKRHKPERDKCWMDHLSVESSKKSQTHRHRVEWLPGPVGLGMCERGDVGQKL